MNTTVIKTTDEFINIFGNPTMGIPSGYMNIIAGSSGSGKSYTSWAKHSPSEYFSNHGKKKRDKFPLILISTAPMEDVQEWMSIHAGQEGFLWKRQADKFYYRFRNANVAAHFKLQWC